MNIKDKETILEWSRDFQGKIHFTVFSEKDEQGLKIQDFCNELEGLIPSLKIIAEEDVDLPIAEISINNNISYHAVPTGMELEPFLDVLFRPDQLIAILSGENIKLINKIKVPSFIKVYISPDCMFCPGVVTQCLALALKNPTVHVSVIDCSLFPEPAGADNILSVPSVLFDEYRWTGSFPMEELIEMIIHRDPMNLGTESIKQMIQEGRASDLAGIMLDNGEIMQAFPELLIDVKWPVRLGAMVVFEYLVEKEHGLISGVIKFLWERFCDLEDNIRGDILYMFGESRDRSVIPLIKTVLDGPFSEDVKDAAKEALTNIS